MKTLGIWYRMISPSNIDATLYVLCALFVFQQSFFSSDDAYKYVHPMVLFWIKCVIGSASAMTLALKMYRSTGYAESKNKKEVEVKKAEVIEANKEVTRG